MSPKEKPAVFLDFLLIKWKSFSSLKNGIHSAVISWGNPVNPPILMVHGFMDSASTFYILMDRLPDTYYYVAFDMPGHGKSDPLPRGMHAKQMQLIEPIRIIVEHLGWKRFKYIGHSMGGVMGAIFNYIYPDYIERMVFIDPLVPLSNYYKIFYRHPNFFHRMYREYYDNYQQWNSGKPKLHTFDKAISLVVRSRKLTEEQAEIVLSRVIVPMGIDTYKLSWEPRMRKISEPPLPEETLYTIMTSVPPSLCLDATEYSLEPVCKDFAEGFLRKCDENLPNFNRTTVFGGHDIHVTNSKVVAKKIVEFLEADLKNVFLKSKL